jgi:hypothetical protein
MSGRERQNRQCSMKDRVAEATGQPSLPRASLRKCLAKTPKRGLNAKNVPKPRWLSGQTSVESHANKRLRKCLAGPGPREIGGQLLKSPCDLRVRNANSGAIWSR